LSLCGAVLPARIAPEPAATPVDTAMNSLLVCAIRWIIPLSEQGLPLPEIAIDNDLQ